MSYLYSKLPETGVSPLIGTGEALIATEPEQAFVVRDEFQPGVLAFPILQPTGLGDLQPGFAVVEASERRSISP
jgi:hypothetical protein